LVKLKQIPKLPKEVKPIIITGLDALGRNSEADRLVQFSQELQAGIGPEASANILIQTDFARRVGAARGIDTKGLIKTEEKLKEEQQAAEQAAMQQQSIGPAINAGAKIATTDAAQEAAQQLNEQ
jgi:hypothetical protein